MRNLWWKDATIYELYVDRFAGTFRGLVDRLGYLEDLGVNTLHILPHFPSPMRDGGYDVMDYLNVRPELGTLDDFDALVTAARARGMRIMIDFVLNHVSEHHPWFLEARTSRDTRRRDFFHWSDTGLEWAGEWNAIPESKSSNWIRNEATQDFYYATFYPEQPDLNWANPAVFDAMITNMEFWADRGVSAFRLDAVRALVKHEDERQDEYETHDIVRRIRAHLDHKYDGEIALLAEAHLPLHQLISFFGNDDECQLVYNFPLAEALVESMVMGTDEHLEDIAKRSQNIPRGCAWATFIRNHDELSLATLPHERREALMNRVDAKRRYVFGSGGGPALRLADLVGDERIDEAYARLIQIPGAPIIYYGDEIGMHNMPHVDSSDAREYVRGMFDWDAAERLQHDSDSLLKRMQTLMRSRPRSLQRAVARMFGAEL